MLAFGKQARKPLLAGFGGGGFSLAAASRSLALRSQPGGDRAGFAARRGELGFQRAGVGGARARGDRQKGGHQRAEQRRRAAAGDEISSMGRHAPPRLAVC